MKPKNFANNKRIRTGLTGEKVLDTKISFFDYPHFYVHGYPFIELIENASYIEVVGLLLDGELPSDSQQATLNQQLNTFYLEHLPANIIKLIKTALTNNNTSDVIIACMALLGGQLYHHLANIRDQALYLIATFSKIFSTILQQKNPIKHNQTASEDCFIKNFMINSFGELETEKYQILSKLFVLACEGNLNTSSFAARVATSAKSNLHCALIAGMATWIGSRHGGASASAYRDMSNLITNKSTVKEYYSNKLKNGEILFGFGHRIFKDGKDERIKITKALAEQAFYLYGGQTFPVAIEAETYLKTKKIYPNPELYIASILESCGFEADQMPWAIFMGRIIGMLAHIIEEQGPLRVLFSPSAEYRGAPIRHYPQKY